MFPIVSFVGKSGSGKTTVLEGVVAELKRRGHRVGVIKHAGELEFDKEGKDSWRFIQAGSNAVVVSSPKQAFIIKNLGHELAPHELAQYISSDCDLIVAEGFKKSNLPKIEVHRKELGKDLVCPPQQLLAVVTDEPLEVSIPQFATSDINGLADLVEKCAEAAARGPEVELFVNGAAVPLTPFVGDIISRGLLGMVSSLKGVDRIDTVRITVRRRG